MMIVVGGVAGYLASRITKTERSVMGNIVVGVVGAILLNIVLSKGLGLHFGGLAGQFLTAAVGACLLILAVRAIRKG